MDMPLKGSVSIVITGVLVLAFIGAVFVTTGLGESSDLTGSVIVEANTTNESIEPDSVDISAGQIVRVDISSG